jgi:hypothetical protein
MTSSDWILPLLALVIGIFAFTLAAKGAAGGEPIGRRGLAGTPLLHSRRLASIQVVLLRVLGVASLVAAGWSLLRALRHGVPGHG